MLIHPMGRSEEKWIELITHRLEQSKGRIMDRGCWPEFRCDAKIHLVKINARIKIPMSECRSDRKRSCINTIHHVLPIVKHEYPRMSYGSAAS